MSFGLGRGPPQETTVIEELDDCPWMAASDGDLPLLFSALRSRNLPVTAADDNGYTFLQASASYGHVPIMEWLLGQSVDVNAVDNDGDTALHYAETVEVAKVLIEAGIDRNIRNQSGKTALETKREDFELLMADDSDADDDEVDQIRSLFNYLSSLETPSQ